MKTVTSTLGSLFVVLFLLALLLVTTLVAGLGIVLVGRVLAAVSGLSPFEASLIALGVALAIVGILVVSARRQSILEALEDDEEDDDYDDILDEEEDEEEFTPPPSRNDLCPCGSGRKYKNCHGRNM